MSKVKPTPEPPVLAPQQMAQVIERLSDADKAAFDNAKIRRELGLAKAQMALAQSEASELAYQNVLLTLALKYSLVNGDTLNEDGTIQRKTT